MQGPSAAFSARSDVIVFDGVTFSYRDAGEPAVLEVDLRLGDGERVALVGPNGSGKSTLALLANGILVPHEGRVLVDGLDTAQERVLDRVRSAVGLVLQNPDDQIVGATVEEDVAFGPENLALHPDEIVERVRAAIAAVGLSGLERREPHTLSEGQKQRLAIAGALAMQPRHLVLDEPTAMLDPIGRREVLEAVARFHREGRGVVHITHDAAEIALCDRAVGLRGGRVAFDGPVSELLCDEAAMADLGIEPAPLWEVGRILAASGIQIPLNADARAFVEALWC